MKHPKGLCQNPLITLIGWHIDSGTACGTCKQPFEIANHRVQNWVLKTKVNGSTSDGKIASLPLMTRSLILGRYAGTLAVRGSLERWKPLKTKLFWLDCRW